MATKQSRADALRELLNTDHIFNLCAIERKLGIRKLKLNEWRNGRTYLEDTEVLKINKLLRNANKLQK